jgi:hypothetical protein
MTVRQFVFQFLHFLAVFCVLMPVLGAMLAYWGLKAFGLAGPSSPPEQPTPEPPKSELCEGDLPEVKSEMSGDQPRWRLRRWLQAPIVPPPLTFGYCVKVFLGATFTSFLLLGAFAPVMPVDRDLLDTLIHLGLSIVVQSSLAVVFLLRLNFGTVAVVFASYVLTNGIAFGTALLLRQLITS